MTSQETQFGLARSADGRTFSVQTVADELQVGALVALQATGATFLGQVLSAGADRPVHGVVMGELTRDGLAKGRRPFADAAVFGLTAEQVQGLQASGGASLPIGQWQLPANDSALMLRPQGFNRHTFLCGQSGSGKTYALGVILEQLILETRLPMVIMDPNGDYVSLGDPRPDAPAGPAEAIRNTPIEVRGAHGPDRVIVTFLDLPPRVQAAVLELDPIRDRTEYAAWMEIDVASMRHDSAGTIEQLLAGDEHRMLPVGIALIGAKLDLPTVAVIGWFGPRGLASVVFALLALDGLLPDDGVRVVSIITATVLMSVILHGATAAPISWRYSGGSTVPAAEPR